MLLLLGAERGRENLEWVRMEKVIASIRVAVENLAASLGEESFAMIPASRGLRVLVDKQFETELLRYKWYSVISRGGHTHAVAIIGGKRISMQRYVLTLQNPSLNVDEVKQVSFANKLTYDCRLSNLTDRVGRTAVMRNRRPKSNSTSVYKGVSRTTLKSGETRWKVAIKASEKSLHLGTFDDENWAAKVYDAAAFLLFENSGLYNFPNAKPDVRALELAADRIARQQISKGAGR